MVDDAVDDRGGEFVVGEDRPPFAELDVRGEDDAATFVAAGDDLVEETGPVDVEGHVAELVEDDQVGTGEVPEQAVEGAVAFGLAGLGHELRGLRNLTLLPCSMASMPRAVARWVFPRPVLP